MYCGVELKLFIVVGDLQELDPPQLYHKEAKFLYIVDSVP